jgi:YidC/Oxa1 family membrane protein insertase
MEHARIFLAIFLAFLVFLVWDFLFTPKQPVPPPEQTAESVPAERKPSSTKETPYPISEPSSVNVAPQEPAPAAATARIFTVDTPIYQAQFSENGAAVVGLVLKAYRETVDAGSPLKELVSREMPQGTVLLGFDGNSLPHLDQAHYTADTEEAVLSAKEQPAALSFTYRSSQGVVIEKTYTFDPKSYLIGLRVTVKNGSSQPLQDRLVVTLNKIVDTGKSVYGFQGPSVYVNGKVEQISLKDIPEQDPISGSIEWGGIQSRYFMTSLLPKTANDATFRVLLADKDKVSLQYLAPLTVFSPGTQQSVDFQLFQGPKSFKLLRTYPNHLAKAVDFGMFDFLAKPCLWLMNFIHDHLVANYGIAIIMLTLLTKILLWPLGTKSYKSMSQMKKLQPLIKEIREKYPNDRKKQNEETMSLYRTYKINPLGGCLPMLVQIPVFFALYRMLYEAIELRHAPFLLWINDLSAPDRLFRFGFSIPFMQPPYGVPVLTLIMGASMLLQQKMSPPHGRSGAGQDDDVDAGGLYRRFHQLFVRTCLVLVGE